MIRRSSSKTWTVTLWWDFGQVRSRDKPGYSIPPRSPPPILDFLSDCDNLSFTDRQLIIFLEMRETGSWVHHSYNQSVKTIKVFFINIYRHFKLFNKAVRQTFLWYTYEVYMNFFELQFILFLLSFLVPDCYLNTISETLKSMLNSILNCAQPQSLLTPGIKTKYKSYCIYLPEL